MPLKRHFHAGNDSASHINRSNTHVNRYYIQDVFDQLIGVVSKIFNFSLNGNSGITGITVFSNSVCTTFKVYVVCNS